jgi:hypothetical protein
VRSSFRKVCEAKQRGSVIVVERPIKKSERQQNAVETSAIPTESQVGSQVGSQTESQSGSSEQRRNLDRNRDRSSRDDRPRDDRPRGDRDRNDRDRNDRGRGKGKGKGKDDRREAAKPPVNLALVRPAKTPKPKPVEAPPVEAEALPEAIEDTEATAATEPLEVVETPTEASETPESVEPTSTPETAS